MHFKCLGDYNLVIQKVVSWGSRCKCINFKKSNDIK